MDERDGDSPDVGIGVTSAPDLIRFTCDKCAKRLRAPIETRGRAFHCPKCGADLVVPIVRELGTELVSIRSAAALRRRNRWAIGGVIGVLAIALGGYFWRGAELEDRERHLVAGRGDAPALPANIENPTDPAQIARKLQQMKDEQRAKPRRGDSAEVSQEASPTPPIVVAGPPPGIELPPVAPTPPAPEDAILIEFKRARAAYLKARQNARAAVREQFAKLMKDLPRPDLYGRGYGDGSLHEVRSSNDLQAQFIHYGGPRNRDDGPLPHHPAMKAIVSEYWKAIETATRDFGAAADRALAAYAKLAAADPAKLRPLQGVSLAAKHAHLIGVWSTPQQVNRVFDSAAFSAAPADVWIVDVDETTGTWRIDGELMHGGLIDGGQILHARNIRLADDQFFFLACPVDSQTKTARAHGTRASLNYRDGALHFNGVIHSAGFGNQVVEQKRSAELRRSGDERARESIASRGVPVNTADIYRHPVEKLDIADANSTWRHLAYLASYQAVRKQVGSVWGQMQYIPFRSNRTTPPRGPLGALGMLAGDAGRDLKRQEAYETLFQDYDRLAGSPHPFLRRAASEFLAVCRARVQLAEADQRYGNTPDSAFEDFRQKVVLPGLQYVSLRIADESDLRDRLERENPGYIASVQDAPLSEESSDKLDKIFQGVSEFGPGISQRQSVSTLLALADMTLTERQSALWQTWLLPLAKRCSGPATDRPLATVEPEWRWFQGGSPVRFQVVERYLLKNISGQDLSHVVVEVQIEDEWGDKTSHYYYFSHLEAFETVWLIPTYRWKMNRLQYTNRLAFVWSVWSDENSETMRSAKFENPNPAPDAAQARNSVLSQERRLQGLADALGAAMRTQPLLMVRPERQRRRIAELISPENSYAVRLVERGELRGIRFKRPDAEASDVRAELFDLGSDRASEQVWQGRWEADPKASAAIRFDSGWTLQLGEDDGLKLSQPEGDHPARGTPLMPVKRP